MGQKQVSGSQLGQPDISGIQPKEHHPLSADFLTSVLTIARQYGVEPPVIEFFSDPNAFHRRYCTDDIGIYPSIVRRAAEAGKKPEEIIEGDVETLTSWKDSKGMTAVIADKNSGKTRYLVCLSPKMDDEAEKSYFLAAEAAHVVHGKIAKLLGLKRPNYAEEIFDHGESYMAYKREGRDTTEMLAHIREGSFYWDFGFKDITKDGGVWAHMQSEVDHYRACYLFEKLIDRFTKPKELTDALLLISTYPNTDSKAMEAYVEKTTIMNVEDVKAAAERRRTILGLASAEEARKTVYTADERKKDPEI
ncbi:MAG: hypothetical protein KKD39_09210, partial [Candidatus Altiarchaeota archaeon]|nr:hypothetical protein [Candidatus Altiarchaeota archaeon]